MGCGFRILLGLGAHPGITKMKLQALVDGVRVASAQPGKDIESLAGVLYRSAADALAGRAS